MKLQHKLLIFLSLLAMGAAAALLFTHARVNADFSLPPRPPGATDPDADTPPPAEEPPIAAHPGGFIVLSMENPSPRYWVVVQWYNRSDRTWHTSSGWQGNFDHEGQVVWWVAPEDMGKGPFRWLVLSELNGRELAVSDSFHLPTRELETVYSALPEQK